MAIDEVEPLKVNNPDGLDQAVACSLRSDCFAAVPSLTRSNLLGQFTEKPEFLEGAAAAILVAGTVALAFGGWRYAAGSAARTLETIEALSSKAEHAQKEFGPAIEYLRKAGTASSPAELTKGSNGLLNGLTRLDDSFFQAFGVGGKSWLIPEPDGGILLKETMAKGTPYVRFFADGGYESGSNYTLDSAGFFVNPDRSLRVLADGSKIYWQRGVLGKLAFLPNEKTLAEPWAQSVNSLVDSSRRQWLSNIKSTVWSGVSLRAGLARELRGSNLEEAFSYVPANAIPFGTGREALALRHPDGDVLRLTRNLVDRPAELSDYLLQPSELYRGLGWQLEKLPYLPKHVWNHSAVKQLQADLKTKGYNALDLHPGNTRILNGRPILIDPGAIERLPGNTPWRPLYP